MSDVPLDLRGHLARIDRMFEESDKLMADAAKLERDRPFLPWTVVATLLGSGAALFAAGAAFMKLFGHG